MPPSYFTLVELLAQRQNAINFGMDATTLDQEIEAQRKHEAGQNVPTRPFDQDID